MILSTFQQLPLFPDTEEILTSEKSNVRFSEYGTFKDSMKAPIHNWFRYPAGFSYKLVAGAIERYGISKGDWIYDPFSGTGTTIIVAKQNGINAYGVEAHSFVHWVASVKLFWEYDYSWLYDELNKVIVGARNRIKAASDDLISDNIFPELIYKCYHPKTLAHLFFLREFILNEITDKHVRDLAKLALTDTLRSSAAAGTGWPYIAPKKNTGDKPPKDALYLFEKSLVKMYKDLRNFTHLQVKGEVHNILGDSREKQNLANDQVALALTSPPYLNNYDYADRTRLETYFWGITKTWKDITEQFRNKLMVAATTQVVRKNYRVETALSENVKAADQQAYTTIQNVVLELSKLRLTKGGKKDYDLMVALYFNDMLNVLQETYRVLKPGGHFCIVVGDSAPYGVYIPTHELIARIALGVGFEHYEYEEFRVRGGKWKGNPQRHKVQLQEGVVILRK